MGTFRHSLYRFWISIATLIDFFCKSFVRWPFSVWLSFWFSKKGAPYRVPNTPDIAVRTNSFIKKVIDSHTAFTCIIERQYEPTGFEIRAGDTVVDIGAHIGSFALLASARLPAGRHGRARVIACEPSPRNFRILSENIARNHAQNITVLPVCVAGQNGMRELFLDTQNAARNGLYGSGHSISVPAITLVELFKQHGMKYCDFLKIDCEGAEYEIIEATPIETLERIRNIAMEYHLPPYFGLDKTKHRFSSLVQKLKRAGFTITIVPENKLRGLLFAHR